MSTSLADYDYALPQELIATRPLSKRDDSRMMVLHRDAQTIKHRSFSDLPQFVREDDLVVLNDTRVLAARRSSDDGAVELLLLERLPERRWRCLVRPGRKMRLGSSIKIAGVTATVEEISPDGGRVILLSEDVDLFEGGAMPLPPYIKRESDVRDVEQYQTVFARELGAIAAPTAGLHFTQQVLRKVPHTFITLHVGPGTFRPVQSEQITGHKMHAERFSISAESAGRIREARRIIAVGTTVVRTLEAAARNASQTSAATLPTASVELRKRQIVPKTGETDIFIYPPFQFQVVDALLTNFHLPRSTLLMLVSAFAGREFILRAYEEAIRHRYRFYSYGDCMLIL